MISPKRIKFRNKTNIDYDVIVDCAFESGDSGETESFLNREAVTSETYDGSYTRIHGYKYDEPLTATITFIKRDFGNFDERENRSMLSWLTSSRNAEKLEIYQDDSEVLSYVLYGGFTSVQQYKMANSRVVGYVCEFSNISPYAFSPVSTIEKTIVMPETFTVNCLTDEDEKPVYTKITITFNNSGYLQVNENPMDENYEMMENVIYEYNSGYYVNVGGFKQTISGVFNGSIDNQTADDRTVGKYYYAQSDGCLYKGVNNGTEDSPDYALEKVATIGLGVEIKNVYINDNDQDITVKSTVTGCHYNEVVIIDGSNKLITSSETPMRIIGEDFNWIWPYIMYGDNTITITGNCVAKIEWFEPRKVGQL